MTHSQNLIYKTLNKVALATILTVSSLSAHSLWVNSFESFNHKPHTIVSIGWGHTLPIDDILNSPGARIGIENFSIVAPNGKKTELFVPKLKIEKPSEIGKDFDVYKAEIGLQKIALKEDSQKGVYKIQAKSQPTFYTSYIDTKDRKRLKLKPMDEIKNIKKVNMAIKYQAFASSYLTIGKWENPKPTGTDLEIRPLSDLSNVKVGDLLKFEVTFKGKPLSYTKDIKQIQAHSNTFGQGEKFFIASYLMDGKAQFRVQSKGQWIVSTGHAEQVTKDGPLKDLYGKVNSVAVGASITFNVK